MIVDYEQYENVLTYNEAFRKGYGYVLYGSDKDKRVEPTVDYSDLSSIGYYDGYQYGEYCELTSQTMSISGEHLIAVISKAFSRAIDKYRETEDKYAIYKTGFIDGKSEVNLRCFECDPNYNAIPEVDENDIYSVGYYDGYCYYLNKILNDNSELEQLEETKVVVVPVDVVSRQCFRQSLTKYPAFSKGSNTK